MIILGQLMREIIEWWIHRTRSSAIADIARDAVPWNGYLRSLKVIRCCANWRGIYMYNFLLAFN